LAVEKGGRFSLAGSADNQGFHTFVTASVERKSGFVVIWTWANNSTQRRVRHYSRKTEEV
jgi:hypothetical protein